MGPTPHVVPDEEVTSDGLFTQMFGGGIALLLDLHVGILFYSVASITSRMRSIVFSRWSSDLSDDQT